MNKVKKSVLFFLFLCSSSIVSAQTTEERLFGLEKQLQAASEKASFMPQLHGILRGKYEYEPDLGASRFEVRNARLSVEGKVALRSSYKLEVDLCDESAIKMKDAWVRVNPWSTLRITLGQQRMPFSIDAHRNPSAQYFANRSFIAKQVGDMRDVGAAIGYDFKQGDRKVLSVDAGVYNGSNLDNQKTAWFTSPAYSARLQYFPVKGLAIMPSVQHQLIAAREASYISFDFGSYYEHGGLHLEAEYLRKFYAHDTFDACNAVDVMVIYRQPLKRNNSFIQSISYLARYDYMDNHSDGKKGMDSGRLIQTDAERHRLTAGLTFSVRNKYFPTDIRLNYEKYFYPNTSTTSSAGSTPKESEQDKLVAELMIRF